MRAWVIVDFYTIRQSTGQNGHHLFDAFVLRFVNLAQTVFLGNPHIHKF